MTKNLVCLFFLFIALTSADAQKHTPTDNDIHTSCECYSFYDACSGKKLNISGSVTLYCILWDGLPWDRTIAINDDGEFCPGGLLDGCEDPEICLNSGNWEICDVSGCKIYLFQTFPLTPQINGTQIGNGIFSGSTGGVAECVGRVHAGPLNNIHSSTELLICPGDEVILTVPGMSIPENSGLCLFVTIKNTNGGVLYEDVYDSSSVNGNQVNLTSLFSGLQNETYIIEFQLTCCNGDATCTVNTFKSVYITIEGQFSYSAWANAGFFPNTASFSPSSSPPSSQLPDGIPFAGGTINQLSLPGHSVINTNDTEVDFVLNSVDCSDPTSGGTQIASGTTTPVTGLPMEIGAFAVITMTDCQCLRLDLTYDDGCGGGNTTDSYFFKDGPNCPPGALQDDEDDDLHLRSSGTDGAEIKLIRNPVDNLLQFSINNQLSNDKFDLIIYDQTGRAVESMNIDGNQSTIEVPFNYTSGVYYYTIRGEGKQFSGKFIKS